MEESAPPLCGRTLVAAGSLSSDLCDETGWGVAECTALGKLRGEAGREESGDLKKCSVDSVHCSTTVITAIRRTADSFFFQILVI